jgi:lipid-A-disaccharide synthase
MRSEKGGDRTVMIVAGEASGDLHGAGLVRALRRREPALSFCGIGGSAMRAAGVEILADAAELAVVGITEVVAKIPRVLRAFGKAKKALCRRAPAVLILIDFPDFNLRLAAAAKKAGVKVLYYISPQIWAWRSGRVRHIKRVVDHMAVILPFEEAFYRRHGVPVTYVGHPLLDAQPQPAPSPQEDRPDSDDTVIGLLPGSRDGEIDRHLPVMMTAARLLTRRLPKARFLIPLAPTASEARVSAIVARQGGGVDCTVTNSGAGAVFACCRLAVLASGTATLEAALATVPMVVLYRVSPLSYWLGRCLIRVNHIAMVNLIAEREVVPELIQHRAQPETVADQVLALLSDDSRLERMRGQLVRVRETLGTPGASKRVADIVMEMLDGNEAS